MAKKAETRHNDVPVSEIPEVAAYQAARARYEQFQKDNPQFFQYLTQLAEELSQTQQAAEHAVRVAQVSCGDFHLYQWAIKLDAETAYQIHGHEKFLALGGSLETITKKSLDKNRYLSNVKAGTVTRQEADAVVSKEPRFHKPDPLVLP